MEQLRRGGRFSLKSERFSLEIVCESGKSRHIDRLRAFRRQNEPRAKRPLKDGFFLARLGPAFPPNREACSAGTQSAAPSSFTQCGSAGGITGWDPNSKCIRPILHRAVCSSYDIQHRGGGSSFPRRFDWIVSDEPATTSAELRLRPPSTLLPKLPKVPKMLAAIGWRPRNARTKFLHIADETAFQTARPISVSPAAANHSAAGRGAGRSVRLAWKRRQTCARSPSDARARAGRGRRRVVGSSNRLGAVGEHQTGQQRGARFKRPPVVRRSSSKADFPAAWISNDGRKADSRSFSRGGSR
jgi:hypothetical protein